MTATGASRRPGARARLQPTYPAALGLAMWAALVAASYLWGHAINRRSRAMLLDAPPLFGRWHPQLGTGVIPGFVVATVVVIVGPVAADRMPWRRLLAVVPLAASGFAIALSQVDGSRALLTSLMSPAEYGPDVARIGSVGRYLHRYVAHLPTAPIQVQAHPPGMVLVLWALHHLGLGSPWWSALLIIAIGSTGAAAAMLALRQVAGEAAARVAAPFMVVLPAAIWVATSADALFSGVAAWAVALLILATGRPGRTGDRLALGAGLFGGCAMYLTYGSLLMACVPLLVVFHRRAARPVVIAVAGAGIVTAAFAIGGFWWPDGLRGTMRQYRLSVTRDRPTGYFLLANLGAFALALGPSVIVGLSRPRRNRAWLILGGGLLAVAAADLSGFSKGEVERIWLLFVPWVAIATCSLTDLRGRPARAWLGLQASSAVSLQILLRTPW